MLKNFSKKTIQIKIVYYGCALSGKTTSLKWLFNYFGHAQKVRSIETTTGRTLFFDLGTLVTKYEDWKIKILLYTTTGQDFYASTRPSVLIGTDGIIFLVDSQRQFLGDNIQSWKELFKYYSTSLYKIPLVICLNKRDLANLIDRKEAQQYFEIQEFEHSRLMESIAISGEGVYEVFQSMINFILPSFPPDVSPS